MDGYREGRWGELPNYECEAERCRYSTTSEARIRAHVEQVHGPGAKRPRRPAHPPATSHEPVATAPPPEEQQERAPKRPARRRRSVKRRSEE